MPKGVYKRIPNNESIVCPFCKKEFSFPKWKKKQFCSKGCSVKYRWDNFDYREKMKKHIPWSKGKTGVYSKKRIRQIEKQQQKLWANPIYRKHMSDVHKGKYAGQNHPNWKGGRHKVIRDYIVIYKPKHPFCDSQGYIREHRFVMEQHLSRFLKPEEVVHHINKITSDNRIENLMLFANDSEHKKFHHPKGIKFSKIIHI